MSVYNLKVTQLKSFYLGSQFFQMNSITMAVIIFLLTEFRNTFVTFGFKTSIRILNIQSVRKTVIYTIHWFKYRFNLPQIALLPKFLSIKIGLLR